MNAKSRLKKIEDAKRKAAKGNLRTVIMWDGYDDVPATFDGVKMTQAEAEAKAAALPEDVLLIHVVLASQALPK
jgi:hypothetical protein